LRTKWNTPYPEKGSHARAKRGLPVSDIFRNRHEGHARAPGWSLKGDTPYSEKSSVARAPTVKPKWSFSANAARSMRYPSAGP
jgi:hypothetical protein